jgi:hypothetical protein
MRQGLLTLLLAALTAFTGPTALHFYHKAQTLDADLARMQRVIQPCAPTSLLDETVRPN